MEVLIGILVVAYLASGLRRVYIARKPTFSMGRQPFLKSTESLSGKNRIPFLRATPQDDDPEQFLDESSKPLFPALSPREPLGSDLDRALVPPDPGLKPREKRKSNGNMFNTFLDSIKSLFSPKEWKSTGLKKSRIVEGKVDSRHGMEPFKKPGRASDWAKKQKK